MAINPKTLKAMFGKLVPYTDDIAKGVVNYGDDAARLVANYGDDVARATANYGDDALRAVDGVPKLNKITNVTSPDRTFDFTNQFGQTVSADYNKPGVWNIGGKTFHDLAEGTLRTSQSDLKESLLNKRTDRGHPYDFTESRLPLSEYFPEYDAVPYYDEEGGIADYDLVEIPGTARPHKNTALGKWYANKSADFESLSSTAPDLDSSTTAFSNAEDQNALTDFLNTEDMLKRVNDATYGKVPGISDSDAFAYVSKMPNLNYVDPNTLEYLHNVLSKRYSTSKKLQNTFGQAPSSFASNDEYSNALTSLFDELNKLPF